MSDKPDFDFLNKNYKELQNLHFKANITVNEEMEIIQKIYGIEVELSKIKKEHGLFNIDPSISSKSVYESFERPHEEETHQVVLFHTKEKIKSKKDYFKAIDYQYYLMLHLLLNNNKLSKPDYGLVKVIESFIHKYGEINFKYEDLLITESGATRCRTNLRFAFEDLRSAGLINQLNENKQKVYRLSYFGFFVIIRLAIKNGNNEKNIFSLKMKKSNASNYYFKLDPHIKDTITELGDEKAFYSVFDLLEKENLGLPTLENASKIFGNFKSVFNESDQDKKIKNLQKSKNVKKAVDDLNAEYRLEDFMKEISLRFNAEDYFRNELNMGLVE